MLWLVVILLGLVEGLTEFIPVSSTGHLLLADHFLGFEQLLGSKEKADLFDIAIQAGAILAVGWLYRGKLPEVAAGAFRGGSGRRLLIALFIAFLPVAVVGLALHKVIQRYLFFPAPIAWALVAGGVAIGVIEWIRIRPRSSSVDQINYRQAFAIGVAQVLSLIPGVSRSGATISSGRLLGFDRTSAATFSFMMSMPIIAAAALLEVPKALHERGLATPLLVGVTTAAVSGWFAIAVLMRFVKTRGFGVFAIYRLMLGAAVLALVASRG